MSSSHSEPSDTIVDSPNIGKIIRNLILTHSDKDGVFPNLYDHFTLDKMIDYEGTQGRVGILTHKQTKEKIIFKIPLHPGFSIRHEYHIMNKLLGSRKFSPHYCESYGIVRTHISFDTDNPFVIEKGCASMLCDVLLSEYIAGSVTLTERIFSYNAKIVYSLIRQVLMAIEIGRRKYGLVHYDLHSDNILLRKCPKDSLFLYNLGDRQVIIPTYGVYPVIIDFGFAYLKGQTGPLYSQMSHTDAGYLACLYDPYYDARVFLMNVSADLSQFKTQREKSFREKVLAMYNHLQIDTEKGWDIRKGQYSASEMIIFTIAEMEKKEKLCKFFDDEGYHCVNIIQTLIDLPLKNKKDGDFRPYYRTFIKEFVKFENTVKSSHNKLLILSQLVDSARKAKRDYFDNVEDGVRTFRKDFATYIDKSLSFYQPPEDVNYSILLTSMYQMAERIETVYFRVMKDLSKEKKEQYKSPVENMAIYDMVDVYYSTEYKLYPSSTVYIWDIESEKSIKLTDFDDSLVETFNKTNNRARSQVMWKHYYASNTVWNVESHHC
jgi:hypothetical protein